MTKEKWWELDYSEWEEIDERTDPATVIAVLKQCCQALNHEDENYIPAIKYAIRSLEGHDHSRSQISHPQ